MNNKDWFSRIFRILITTFVFGFYIAMVFFAFRGNWVFLFTFEYWLDTITSTSLALMFRWLYSDSGINKELEFNDNIRDMENGKSTEIAKVNSINLTDLLKIDVDKQNTISKTNAYKDLCDIKINYYREKSWYKLNRKNKLNITYIYIQ